MTLPDEHYLDEGNNVKWLTFYDAEFEKNNRMVFSRLSGTWPGAPVTEWDFSRYAAGVKDRRLNFLPPYPNGLVLITPPQAGKFADRDAPRGAMKDHLHPIYHNILKEYTTDGRNYLSADGKNTCANICNAMFSYRMLGLKGESKYADIMELVLYNSALSGISADGTHYYYTNPLRRTHDLHMDTTDFENRVPYIPCFCCPPNLVRTIAKVSGWAYSLSDNGVAVNLYGGNKLDTQLLDGSNIQLAQETQYPWDGEVKLTVQSCKDAPFEMMLRIPGWAEESKLLVNGKDAGVETQAGTYATIKRAWKAGDVVTLEMPMEPKLMVGHPRIEEVRNQAAIKRGPVVYCIESPDLPADTDILDVYLPADIEFEADNDPDFLGGLTSLVGNVLLHADPKDAMYSPLKKADWKSVQTRFVPYYAWSNRGESEMTVWLPIVWK